VRQRLPHRRLAQTDNAFSMVPARRTTGRTYDKSPALRALRSTLGEIFGQHEQMDSPFTERIEGARNTEHHMRTCGRIEQLINQPVVVYVFDSIRCVQRGIQYV
jgi:hypothetical protein